MLPLLGGMRPPTDGIQQNKQPINGCAIKTNQAVPSIMI